MVASHSLRCLVAPAQQLISLSLCERLFILQQVNRHNRLYTQIYTCHWECFESLVKGKGIGKGFPYSIPSAGPRADPGVQAVSLQVTASHPPGGRLALLSARPAVTSPATEHRRPLAVTKSYCLVTEPHRCKQLAQGCYTALPRLAFEPVTYWSQVQPIALLHHESLDTSTFRAKIWQASLNAPNCPLHPRWTSTLLTVASFNFENCFQETASTGLKTCLHQFRPRLHRGLIDWLNTV